MQQRKKVKCGDNKVFFYTTTTTTNQYLVSYKFQPMYCKKYYFL